MSLCENVFFVCLTLLTHLSTMLLEFCRDTFNMNPLACNNISMYFIHGILGERTMNLNNKFQASTKAFIYEG